MIRKIDHSNKMGNAKIAILYPGLELTDFDTGYFSIGRIDHAQMKAGTLIAMHPHRNDDILSYFRIGQVMHTDSQGYQALLMPKRLMLMRAGREFYHEEAIQEPLEGLQIFIRPASPDAQPAVFFHELESIYSLNQWRLLASPDKTETPLQLSSQTWIYDLQIEQGKTCKLPKEYNANYGLLLYVYQGSIEVNGDLHLRKGDSLFIREDSISFTSDAGADLVLFVTDTTAAYYDGGMYSGNQKKNRNV